MCSGCSGDYAGGFDADDPGVDDPDDPMADARERAASASFGGTSETELGDMDLGETDLTQGTRSETANWKAPEDASEICEILVTSTHIVEIRVISANWRGQGPSSGRSNDRLGKRGTVLARRAPSKQSSWASAKYYQTRQGSEKTRGYAAHSLRIWRSFAGVCKAKLNGWFRRRDSRCCDAQRNLVDGGFERGDESKRTNDEEGSSTG